MKKFLALVLALSIFMVACSKDVQDTSNTNQDLIEVTSLNGNGDNVQVSVPKNPDNVAVLDLAILDTIDGLGKGDTIKGLSKTSILAGKEAYYDNDSIANLGSVKEVDFEELALLKPQLIFAGGRLASQYDQLSKIAPVVLLSVDTNSTSAYESMKNNIREIAKIYGLEDQVNEKLSAFDTRLETIKEKANNSSALISIVNQGNISLLSNAGRASIIGTDAGFNNLAADAKEDSHGDSASFETILDYNPDYLFVLDRDQAIATEGASIAQDVLDNEIINKTKAAQDNHIIYLNPSVWYLAEGGLGSLDIMLKDIEKAIN